MKQGDKYFPLREGFKPRPTLTREESNKINACAIRRGIKSVGNISRFTVVGGISFQ